MDILDYQQSDRFLNATEPTATGLEGTAEVAKTERDTTNWSTVTTLLSKGLDLGLGIVGKKDSVASNSSVPKDEEEDKIMGMPKVAVYGGIALVGLIGLVIVVKKLKK